MQILIKAGDVRVTATLEDTPTAKDIWDALPFKSLTRRWGDEVAFEIPVVRPEENALGVVPRGSIAYWPPGHHMCIFFGPTPKSVGDECRATSPVNVFGAIDGDLSVLREVQAGTEVTVEKSSE